MTSRGTSTGGTHPGGWETDGDRSTGAAGERRLPLVADSQRALRDELGNIVKWYGTGLEIEDRKRAEESAAPGAGGSRTKSIG